MYTEHESPETGEIFDGYHIEITDEQIPRSKREAINELGRILVSVPTMEAISIFVKWQEYERERGVTLLGAITRTYLDKSTSTGMFLDGSQLIASDIKDPELREQVERTAYSIMQTTAEGKPEEEYHRAEEKSSLIRSIAITPTALDIEARDDIRVLQSGDIDAFQDKHEKELAAHLRGMTPEEREIFELLGSIPEEHTDEFYREELERERNNPENYQPNLFAVADQLGREAIGTGIRMVVNEPKA